jgi:class 3 adenylate cyclase/TolB-like protein
MAEERVERRLAAILAADMVAYSRLMEADEEGTIARQKVHRAELIDPTIAEYGGRIVKLMGDGALVEFPSVVDAVKCAATIQRAMAVREAEVPEDRRILYRMGVNLGDIVIDGDDILGDGVNIAARLESLAEPGGVCISGTAYDQLKATVDVGYADLGEQQVKNIDKPVRVYRVLLDAEATGTVSIGATRHWRIPAIAAALVVILVAGALVWQQPWLPRVDPLPPPGNPSIAVLPFDNLSGDAFAEAVQREIAENVATVVSRLPNMFVIARDSLDPDRDTAEDVLRAAEEFGVRYVLEGSVRRSGEQVGITAKLIEADTGHNLWRQSYDLELQDASALKHEITLKVVKSLKVKLVEEAGASIIRGNTSNSKAYELVRRGLSLFQGGTQEENAEARRLFQDAVKLDPNYSIGWHLLGYTHYASSSRRWREDRTKERDLAIALAHKALADDESSSGPYVLLSTISKIRGQYTQAVALAKKAVALAPNDALTVAFLGQALILSGKIGQAAEALPLIQRAIRLSPYTPPPILFYEGLGYHSLARYKEAMAEFDVMRSANANGSFPLALLAITSAEMGRMEEARAAAQILKSADSYKLFTSRGFVKSLNYNDRSRSEKALAILRELGLPE